MGLRLITPPTEEPLEYGTVVQHLNLDINSPHFKPELIQLWISAAREEAEDLSGEVLMPQTWEQTFDAFPSLGASLELLKKPVISVASIKYVDTDGALQTFGTLDGSPETIQEYTVHRDNVQPTIDLVHGYRWPLTASVKNAIVVQYQAGYSDPCEIPYKVRAGMLLAVGFFHEFREDAVDGSVNDLPLSIRKLLAKPRIG